MRSNIKGALCGILTGACWGLSSVFSQYLFTETTMTSPWFVCVRMLAAGVFLLGLTLATNREELKRLLGHRKDLLRCVATGVLGMMCFQFACYGTVERSNAATAIVLQYLCPVMVMVYTCFRKRRGPRTSETAALILALAGVFLIATHGNIRQLSMSREALCWGIGCAFFMSVCSIMPEKLYQRYASTTVTAAALLSGGVLSTLIVQPWRKMPELDTRSMGVLLAAVVCGSMLAYLVYGLAIQHVGASRASLYACFEIPFSTVCCVLFLGNVFGWLDLIGFGLIASTIFVMNVHRSA